MLKEIGVFLLIFDVFLGCAWPSQVSFPGHWLYPIYSTFGLLGVVALSFGRKSWLSLLAIGWVAYHEIGSLPSFVIFEEIAVIGMWIWFFDEVIFRSSFLPLSKKAYTFFQKAILVSLVFTCARKFYFLWDFFSHNPFSFSDFGNYLAYINSLRRNFTRATDVVLPWFFFSDSVGIFAAIGSFFTFQRTQLLTLGLIGTVGWKSLRFPKILLPVGLAVVCLLTYKLWWNSGSANPSFLHDIATSTEKNNNFNYRVNEFLTSFSSASLLGSNLKQVCENSPNLCQAHHTIAGFLLSRLGIIGYLSFLLCWGRIFFLLRFEGKTVALVLLFLSHIHPVFQRLDSTGLLVMGAFFYPLFKKSRSTP